MKKILIFLIAIFSTGLISSKSILFYSANWGDIFSDNISYFDGCPISSNRDECKKFLFNLRATCNYLGYEVKQVFDLNNINNSNFDYLVCFDLRPEYMNQLPKFSKEKLIAYLWEPPTTLLHNYNKSYHELFCRIFTWHDDLVDNKKYIKFFYPVLNSLDVEKNINFKDKKLCTLIGSDKSSSDPNELYSERRRVIDFFEKLNNNDFDFYGMSWDKTKYRNYKGPISTKIDYLKKYKFCIAYENENGTKGWVTEKLFDCFNAGCVPVYWGAPNIGQYVPSNCYIDRKKFRNTEELYQFIKNITEDEYNEYIKNISNFIVTSSSFKYSWENFVDIFCKNLLPEYDRELVFSGQKLELLKRIDN